MRRVATVSAVLLAAMLAACGQDSPERLMQSARDYLAARDDRAAAIQLRNALQREPRNAEARYLLAQVLARGGDLASAEKEYRRAAEYGVTTNGGGSNGTSEASSTLSIQAFELPPETR